MLTCWQTAHRTMLAKVRAAAGDFGLGGYLYLEKGVRQEIAVMCHSDCSVHSREICAQGVGQPFKVLELYGTMKRGSKSVGFIALYSTYGSSIRTTGRRFTALACILSTCRH